MLKVFCSVSRVFVENIYFLIDEASGYGAILDPGLGALEHLKKLETTSITWKAIFLTHAHFDHLLGLTEVKEYTGASIYLHPDDLSLYKNFVAEAAKFGYVQAPLPYPDHFWKDQDRIPLGETEFQVIHTPGHTPGGVCLKWDRGILTGDTLMYRSIGHTDGIESLEQLQSSIVDKLFPFSDELIIYPGHLKQSDIGTERMFNLDVY